jgi:hypothetical protein
MAVYEAAGIEEARDEVNPLLPHGVYVGEIISSKFKTIENPESTYNGVTMLQYVVKAQGEEYSASAFGTIFLPNPEVMDSDQLERSKAEVKRLQIACGMEPSSLIDDEAFLHCELRVEVIVEKGKDGYEDKNKVKDVLPL